MPHTSHLTRKFAQVPGLQLQASVFNRRNLPVVIRTRGAILCDFWEMQFWIIVEHCHKLHPVHSQHQLGMRRCRKKRSDLNVMTKLVQKLPIVAPGVTKDKVISVSAYVSDDTSRSSAPGDRVRQTASGDRVRDMCEWLEEFTEGLVDTNSKSSRSDRDILQKHFFLSLHLRTEDQAHTTFSRIFRRIQIVKSAGTRKLRELLAEWNPENQDGHLPRATNFGVFFNSRSQNRQWRRGFIGMLLWYKVWLFDGSRVTHVQPKSHKWHRKFQEHFLN